MPDYRIIKIYGSKDITKLCYQCESAIVPSTITGASDNNKCQSCRQDAKIVHHIEPFNNIITQNNIKTFEDALTCSKLWQLDNGLSLCKKCHNNKKIRLLLDTHY